MNAELKIEWLRLDELLDDPDNPGTAVDEEADAALTASIELHGIEVPLICFPTPRGKMLAEGHRRKRCGIAAGKATAPCIVLPSRPDPAELLTMQLTIATHRRSLNPIDELESFQRLATLRNWSQTELADGLAIRKSEVSRVMMLGKLSPQIRELVRAGKISKSSANAIVRLPAEKREEMSRRAAAGELTRNQLDAKARRQLTDDKKARRVCWHVPEGTVTVTNDRGLSLSSVIETLEDLLRNCRKLRAQKLDITTAAKVMKDQACATPDPQVGE